jgi:hypothetical protein
LRLIAITIIPGGLKLRLAEEHDISIGEAGDVSIGDLHTNVA